MTITGYDPFSADVKDNPYPYYAWLREHHPVYHNERLGVWALSRYRDVEAALRNKEVYSSAKGVGPERVAVPTMITKDPPEHTRLRALVSKAFTPRRIGLMESRVREIMGNLLDAAFDRGSFDLVRDVAEPFPVIVISEMLGVAPEHRDAFKRWSDDVIGMTGGDPSFDLIQYQRTWQEFKEYFSESIRQRRNEPREDLISDLASVKEDRDVLSDREILYFILLLLVAGNETTTNLITNGALALLTHPDQAHKLWTQPELVPSAVEECLRFDSPFQASFRTTTREMAVDGVTIPADSKVMMIYGSANRDPEQFEDADSFNVERHPNDHLAFAVGVHFCLGAHLARLEAGIALKEVVDRMNNIRVDPASLRTRVDNPMVRGLKTFPLLFDRC